MAINIARNAVDYDWETWGMGIMRSFMTGGASALAGASAPMVIDPEKFNLGSQIHNVGLAMLWSFVLTGIVHLGVFLQTHGAPEKKTMTDVIKEAEEANVEIKQKVQKQSEVLEKAKQVAESEKKSGD